MARVPAVTRRAMPAAALAQGVYYVASLGLWPFVHYGSFEAVTGRKVDDWLVRAIAGLGGTVGVVLLLAAGRGRGTSPEAVVLGLGSAATLTAVDVYYALKGRISKVYLLDALGHVPLFALWARDLLAARRDARERATASPPRPSGR